MGTNRRHSDIAHRDEVHAALHDTKRAFAEHRGRVDRLAFKQIIGPSVCDALARARKLTLGRVAEGA